MDDTDNICSVSKLRCILRCKIDFVDIDEKTGLISTEKLKAKLEKACRKKHPKSNSPSTSCRDKLRYEKNKGNNIGI